MTTLLDWLAELRSWQRTIVGAGLGAFVVSGSWAGRWWGLASIAVMFGVVYVCLWLAEQALDEADR